MGEPEIVPEHEFKEEAEKPVEMKIRRKPEEEIEEAPAAEVLERRRFREFNPSVSIAMASMAAAVLMVASVAFFAPMELGFVVPWMLGSITVLGIGLGVTATIRCRRR
ncbi:MAG: hypothetical protein ACYS9X_21110 [Planctomycetota bacterium]|jgi:hypothetical protein